MKKLITIITVLGISTVLQAQSIFIDRLEVNGLRRIMATGTKVDIDGGKYDFTLKAYFGEGASFWGLAVSSDLFISEDTELLIKLDNDEVIHLHADNAQSSATTTPEHYTTYHFGGISETFIEPGTERDYYISIFALSEDQVSLLENQAIKKMRISLGSSYLEKSSGLKKLSRWISKSVALIRERSQRPLGVHKSITDGF